MPDGIRELVLQRLGFQTAPCPDLAGLRTIYQSWCQMVPFDNVRKMIALRTSQDLPLPGHLAAQFFEGWLADGAGGTCWPSSNALCELVRSLGFEAHLVAGCMRDLGIINHGSVKVSIDGRDWLIDSSLLSNVPLPLAESAFVNGDQVFAVEMEFEDPTHVVWSHTPPHTNYLPCRLNPDPVSQAYFRSRYEDSRVQSPFNQRLYARRNRPGEMVILLGNTRFSKTAEGIESRDLSLDDLCEALRQDIGLSEDVIDEWVRSGSLAESLQPPSGPKPPPVTRKPPSKR